jgi:hypothetical protein
MLDFAVFDKELAAKETRLAYPDPPSGLPVGPLVFREYYCNEPRCDCRRVLILVSDAKGTPLAGLNYQFEPPLPGDPEPSQLEIDPINRQSRHSERLRDLFAWMVSDRSYHDRLVRHYALFKAAVDDPTHPRHASVRSEAHDDPSHRPAFPIKPATKKGTTPRKAPSARRSASSLYVFSLGPIPAEAGPGTLYFGLLDGRLLPPPEADDAAVALGLLRAKAPPGTALACSPELAKAGARHGFVGEPLPEPLLALRAELALVLSHPGIAPRAATELLPLMQSANAFWVSKVWERLPMDVSIAVTLAGAVRGTYEAAVMGAGGEEFGLALYPKAGSLAAISRAVAEGRMDRVSRIDAISLTLDDEPAFAVHAIAAWCGLPRVPITFAMRGGAPEPLEAADALALAVTLHALSRMTGAVGEVAMHTLSFGDKQIEVTVRLPGGTKSGARKKTR